MIAAPPRSLLMEHLLTPGPLVTVELRPPASDLGAEDGMDAWIDLHHSLRRLTGKGLFVFLTDNAVGHAEEENLSHVGGNVGDHVDLRRVVPILTSKHSLAYCTLFARRAVTQGFDSMAVLGGDRSVGPPRCVEHAQDLRAIFREEVPGLALGGWANPHKDAATQLGYLAASDAHADFALTQIVSHHSLAAVRDVLAARTAMAADRSAPLQPLVFGVFYYRSANPRTLETLNRFFPVPAAEVTAEFESGATPEEICARTIRALRAEGAEKIYVSNLGNRGAGRALQDILERV